MKGAILSNRFSRPGIKGKSDMDLAKFRKGCNRDLTGTASGRDVIGISQAQHTLIPGRQ